MEYKYDFPKTPHKLTFSYIYSGYSGRDSFIFLKKKTRISFLIYAAVNGKLELTLLKGRQRFDTVSTSNLKV